MSGPPPPPPLPDPLPFRPVAYPNYFLGALNYGDAITVHLHPGPTVAGTLLDLGPFGITVWHDERLNHYRWDVVARLSWDHPT